MQSSSAQRVYQPITLRTADGRTMRYGCEIDRNASLLDFFKELEKKGLKIDVKFYQQYGTYLVTEISGQDREGNRYSLKDIQIYVDGKFVHLTAQDGTSGWANAELLKVGDLLGRTITIQSDTHLGNEFLSQDLPKIPVLERTNNDALYNLNRRNGGGASSEPTSEAKREDLEKLRSQTTVPMLVEVADSSFRVTTIDGKEMNDSNLMQFLNREFGLSLPEVPKQAEQTLLQFLDRSIRQVAAEQTQFDGTKFSMEIALRMVATSFDAVGRYQLYVSANTSAEETGSALRTERSVFSLDVNETLMTPVQAEQKFETAAATLDRSGIQRKEIVQEESQIMRLLMNPTERRLWGRLFGLPDEEVANPKVAAELVRDRTMERLEMPKNQPQTTVRMEIKEEKETKKETENTAPPPKQKQPVRRKKAEQKPPENAAVTTTVTPVPKRKPERKEAEGKEKAVRPTSRITSEVAKNPKPRAVRREESAKKERALVDPAATVRRQKERKRRIGETANLVPKVGETPKEKKAKQMKVKKAKTLEPKFAEKKSYGVKVTLVGTTKAPKAGKNRKQPTTALSIEKIEAKTRSKTKKPKPTKEKILAVITPITQPAKTNRKTRQLPSTLGKRQKTQVISPTKRSKQRKKAKKTSPLVLSLLLRSNKRKKRAAAKV